MHRRIYHFAAGWNDKAKERAIEHFEDKDRREAFFKFFRALQSLYDILSPDAFLTRIHSGLSGTQQPSMD